MLGPLSKAPDGEIEILGEKVVFDFEPSEIGGLQVSDGTITFDTEALVLGVNGSLEEEASDVLDFIKGTPLSGALPFVEKDWQAEGRVTIDGQFSMPVGEDSLGKSFDRPRLFGDQFRSQDAKSWSRIRGSHWQRDVSIAAFSERLFFRATFWPTCFFRFSI